MKIERLLLKGTELTFAGVAVVLMADVLVAVDEQQWKRLQAAPVVTVKTNG